MSIEDDIELRDLVAQTLESNGSLAKIRAQLRASVFLALEEDAKVSNQQPLLNNKLKTYQKSAQGKAMFCIVREFLDFFNLDFTISVYEPESYSGSGYKYEGRQKLINDLGLSDLDFNSSGPLLLQILNVAQNLKPKHVENTSVNGDTSNQNITLTNGELTNGDNSLDEVTHNEEAGSELKTGSYHISSKSSSFVDNKNDFNKQGSTLNTENTQPSTGSVRHKIGLEIEIPRVDLNSTFDVSSPTFEKSESKIIMKSKENGEQKYVDTLLSPRSIESTASKGRIQTDDTYEGTSSIAEDDENVGFCNSERRNEMSEYTSVLSEAKSKSPIEQLVNDRELLTPPPNEKKSKYDIDKPKPSPQKIEKPKSKTNLNSLSELPPIPIGKSRVSDILPSLYSKEFKEKTNLKDLDELFDMQADYEEDFISGSEVDLTLNSPSKINPHNPSKLSNPENLNQSAKDNEKNDSQLDDDINLGSGENSHNND